MRAFLATVLLTFATPALAQEAASPVTGSPLQASAVRSGQTLRDAEGKRVGKINRVVLAADGSVEAVKVIADAKMVTVPGGTLRSTDAGVQTTLSKKEVRKLD